MTATARTNINGQPRKTLASQIDRLDGILDGLDAALAGAVQEAVEQAVKQAVQAVLTEVLTNRELQEQLQQAAQPAPPPEPPRGKKSTPNRLWQATTEAARQTVQKVKQFGRGVGMALLAAGGVVAGRRLCGAQADRLGGLDRVPARQTAGAGSRLGPDELPAVVCFQRITVRVET